MEQYMQEHSVGQYVLQALQQPVPQTYVELERQWFRTSVLRYRPVHFFCRCFLQNQVHTVLGSCPDAVLAQLVEDGGGDFTCEYCSQRTTFSRDDVLQVLQQRRSAAPVERQ
uniref:33 kDa chaperonin n=1 Tax=Lygus hesperus TaxID=30085 RepID=A0A0A9WIK7_LYGHE